MSGQETKRKYVITATEWHTLCDDFKCSKCGASSLAQFTPYIYVCAYCGLCGIESIYGEQVSYERSPLLAMRAAVKQRQDFMDWVRRSRG